MSDGITDAYRGYHSALDATPERKVEIANTPLALARSALANAESDFASTGIALKKAQREMAEAAAKQEHLSFLVDALKARIKSLEP